MHSIKTMTPTLQQYLNQIHPLSEEPLKAISESFSPISFERREVITREGQLERYLYFIEVGIQRSYYIKDGKEYIIAFTYPPSFSGIPESFLTGSASLYFLETITPTKALRISRERLDALMDHYREIESLFRKSTESVLSGLIHKHYELMAYSIEERFKAFANRSPHLLVMVPHKFIASYLRIDPTNFSKLLSTVKV